MSPAPTPHELVCDLIHDFHTNKDTYFAPDYKEAQLRLDFLDKFFAALGWDVSNTARADPKAREVRIEQSVVMAEGRKSADYAFSIAPAFERVRFFVEAKKPARKLPNREDCFQAIRYGYNVGNPLSILSDFEDFFVLDCRALPDLPSATTRVVGKWHYRDLLDAATFQTLYNLLAREAVASGSIERFVADLAATPGAKGRQLRLFNASAKPVDQTFLGELEESRAKLANAFLRGNPSLTAPALTEITQRTLDRLVFLRFLEDKLIEPEDRVSRWNDGDAWRSFHAAAAALNAKYNGVLWRHHALLDAEGFAPQGSVWADICWRISNQNTPFLFNLIPIPLLGSIYERFLGNEICIQGNRATVEPKPEVRKAGGVYYTPEFIVQYLCEQTLGPLLSGRTPKEVARFKIADISCGSGSFLLGAFSFLLRFHSAYYNANPAQAKRDGCLEENGVFRLSLAQRRAILLQNIYGNDIDAQAVEVSKLSLYLKLLEDETDSSARQFSLDLGERVLPDLDKNIVCGNALVDYDIEADPETLAKINPMDWRAAFPEVFNAGGFDAIIGNPPYGAEFGPEVKLYIREKFQSYRYKYESYIYFFEQAINLTKTGGYVSYITPELWLKLETAAPIRKIISEKAAFVSLLVCGENIFTQAVVNTVVPLFKIGNPSHHTDSTISISRLNGDKWELQTSDWLSEPTLSVEYRLMPAEIEVANKIKVASVPLATFGEIIQGITAYDKYKGHAPDFIKKRGFHHDTQVSDTCGKWLAGMDVSRYALGWSGEWLNYGDWLGAAREPRFFEGDRILFREIPGEKKRIQATFTSETAYYGHSITPFKAFDGPTSIFYFLGVVNSKLVSWYGSRFLSNLGKDVFPKLNPADVKSLPIRTLNFNDATDQKAHDDMVKLVSEMLETKAARARAETDADIRLAQGRLTSLERRIDALVYRLYDLDADEIALVEA